ncbi:beta-galactosidase 16 [Quercus suber]|uniref:Beta-galactosidase n=1 Tax=Quercus suber TaxID=58331 RepID=A0AAW0KPN3_QUESU
MGWWWRLYWGLAVVIMMEVGGGHAKGVTYDGRSLIINGKRKILFSGSIHYPRSTPQFYMQNFTTKIVNLMKSEDLYASQGGPIILSQIENEYQNIEAAFHGKGPPYVRWAAKMAVGLKTGVPWVMCKQTDAPDPVYHGGTNFGRTSSAYIITAYYDQAPLDEYGLIRQPKWGHLKELHATIKLCSTTLLHGVRRSFSLGEKQEAIVFEGKKEDCAAFLINNDTHNNAIVQFRNISFKLLPKSISILPDCRKITFNTAQVSKKYNNRIITPVQTFGSANSWKEFNDVIVNFRDTSLKSKRLLEQTSTTKDKYDYLWYTLRFQHNLPCNKPILHVESLAHVARAFLNNIYIGSANGRFGQGFSMDIPILLNKGMNNISILSVMVGLQDSGAYLERKVTGLTTVEIQCNKKVLYDFKNYEWGYKVGLLGEELKIYKEIKLGDAVWSKNRISTNQILTWYKVNCTVYIFFNAPKGNDPVALNLSSMGKGETWVNGQSIGRYWISFHDSEGKPSQIITWIDLLYILIDFHYQAINEKILSFHYGEFSAQILIVDSQNSFNGVVLILVTGYLTGKDSLRRKFTHSFFLAPQDKGYFVLNEHLDMLMMGAKPTPVEENHVSETTTELSEPVDGEVYNPPEKGQASIEEEEMPVGILILFHLFTWFLHAKFYHKNSELSEDLYASQGGPIILSQIENEYQNIEAAFHGKGPPYVRLIRQPKWGHLKELHATIKLCSTTLLHGVRRSFSLGEKQEAIVFEGKKEDCAAFLINNDTHNNAIVQFRNISFKLLPKSISILPDCRKITFNTAQIFFNAPKGNDPVALNLSSMGKGETWVNGQSIGRYWISFHDSEGKPSQ